MLLFSSHTQRLLGFARRRDLIVDALERAVEKADHEATFLSEDLWEASAMLHEAANPENRRVLLWLTDGTTNAEDARTRERAGRKAPERLHTPEEAREALLRSGAAFAVLKQTTPESLDPSKRDLDGGTDHFDRFADLTGGPVLTTGNNEAAERMAQLLDELRERSTVGYRPAAGKPPGTHCRLTVTLTPAFFAAHPELSGRKRDLIVQARREYVR